MKGFREGLTALFRQQFTTTSTNGEVSTNWGCLFDNLELLFYLTLGIVAAAVMGIQALTGERAQGHLPDGCPPACVAAQLAGLDLRQADLSDADLSRAALSHANLRDANLQRAILWQTVLVGADLTGADLGNAVLGEADLTGTKLTGADLTGAWYSEGTKWPAGFVPPPTARKMKEGCYVDEQG